MLFVSTTSRWSLQGRLEYCVPGLYGESSTTPTFSARMERLQSTCSTIIGRGRVGHSETEVGMIRLSLEAVKASTSRTVLLPGTVEAVARVLTDIQVPGLCSVITPLRTTMLAGTAPKATATRERALSRFIKIRFIQMF